MTPSPLRPFSKEQQRFGPRTLTLLGRSPLVGRILHGSNQESTVELYCTYACMSTLKVKLTRGVGHGEWILPGRTVVIYGVDIEELWDRRLITKRAYFEPTSCMKAWMIHFSYAFVWNETLRVHNEMLCSEGWLSQSGPIDIASVQTYTFKVTIKLPCTSKNLKKIQLALFIIASCGFGLTFPWDEPPKNEKGDLSLQQSLQITSEKSIMRTEAPRWTWYLPTKEYVVCK